MKRLTMLLALAALALGISAQPAAAEHADLMRAAQTLKQMVEKGRTETLMTEIDLFAFAGLSYQPGLTLPMEGALDCKSDEQVRMMSGMYQFDMNYALAFGRAKAALKTQKFYRSEVLPRLGIDGKVELNPVNGTLVKRLLEDPNNPEVRAKLINQTNKNMLRVAEQSSDEEVMEFVVDSFYGALVQGLYVACTLAKDAEMSPEMVELFMGQFERFQLFNELFQQFEDEAGKRLINFADREGMLHTVMDRIAATRGSLTPADIDAFLALVGPRRAPLLKTCQ